MPSKEVIKRELDFTKNMFEILEVMKQLAQSQFTNRKKKIGARFTIKHIYYQAFFEMTMMVKSDNPFIRCQSDTAGVVVPTSDASFMGALNQKIFKGAKEVPGSKKLSMVLGKKGLSKFKFNKMPFVPFPGFQDTILYDLCHQLTSFIVELVLQKKMGRVYMIWMESPNFGRQVLNTTQLLPFQEIIQESEFYKNPNRRANIAVEGNFDATVETISRFWLLNRIMDMLTQSKAAEFSALAAQMEGSQESLKKVVGKLTSLYKRARNEKVDAGMREIFVATMVAGGG